MSRSCSQPAAGDAASAQPSDEELLRRYCRQGDEAAFEELVRRYHRELFGYLCRLLGDRTAAEDVFQNTFLQLHAKCRQFDPRRKVRPWLYRIATNQAIDYQRRHRRHRAASLQQSVSSDGQGTSLLELAAGTARQPEHLAMQEEDRRRVLQAMNELSDAARQVIELVYYQGLKYREAAEVLDIPVGTVKSRLHAALRKLDQALHREPSQESDKENARHESA